MGRDMMHNRLFMRDSEVTEMKKKYIIKIVVFVLSFGLILAYLTRMMIPEFFYDNDWPTTASYQGFYEMDKNSIDVIFLGSSTAESSFIPQELYNNYGITSYNLGCEQQNLLTSYYWLKEALRFQSPKAVVLESKYLLPCRADEPLNSPEPLTRKAFDYMHWSSVKEEAVKTICTIDKNQSLLGYYLPIIRYHSRWSELSKKDFLSYYNTMSSHYELKGYTAFSLYGNNESYAPFEINSSVETVETLPLMQEYFDNIVELCKENNINLILTFTPSTAGFAGINKTLTQYSLENNLTYLDFNDKTLYDAIDYDFKRDNADNGHANLWGAIKITNYVGRILQDKFSISGVSADQWEDTRTFYENLKRDYILKQTTDLCDYLSILQNSTDQYTIFISVKDEATNNLNNNIIQGLKNLGLKVTVEGQFRCSYLVVLSGNNKIERSGYKMLEESGTIDNGAATYSIISGGMENGNISSIVIDGKEYSKNCRGLNIVVYNNEKDKVVDTVAFDTYGQKMTVTR